MKNKLILFILFLAATPIFCQLKYGFKAGLTSSDQTWEVVPRFAKSISIDSRKGINLGVFAEFSDNKYTGVIIEANFRQKGANIYLDYTDKDTSGQTILPKNLEHKLSYLNLSLLGKLKYEIKFFTPYLIAGLKTDYQLSSKLDDPDIGYIASETTSQIWGVVIGGGFEIKDLLPFTILAEFRTELDFNKLYVEDKFQFKSNMMEFRLGVKF
jgi:hypothetical protein